MAKQTEVGVSTIVAHDEHSVGVVAKAEKKMRRKALQVGAAQLAGNGIKSLRLHVGLGDPLGQLFKNASPKAGPPASSS